MESIATPAMPTSPRTRGMVGVITAVGREIERDREALLAGGDVAAVEGVGIFGRREAGVLADRPGLQRVHRRVGTAHVWRDAGVGIEEVEAGDVLGRVEALDRDSLGRLVGDTGALARGRRGAL